MLLDTFDETEDQWRYSSWLWICICFFYRHVQNEPMSVSLMWVLAALCPDVKTVGTSN
jgi:hypothetical protein